MRIEVIASLDVEGMHSWPEAGKQFAYLASQHRHIFKIRCGFPVDYPDRQIEVIWMQEQLRKYLRTRYGVQSEYGLLGCVSFGSSSCESIAIDLLAAFEEMSWCEVTEDEGGGAYARR